MTIRPFHRKLWSLTAPYWRSEDRWMALALLLGALACHVGLTLVGVGFNLVSGATFNAIQDHDLPVFLHQLLLWGGLFVILLAAVTFDYYFSQLLRLRWRRWLTCRLLEDWLQHHYRLQLTPDNTDNPDQRIAEDVALFVNQTCDLFLGLFHAVLGIGAFAAILWRLSDDFDLFGLKVPGFLLWAAVLYSLVGSLLTHLFGGKLAWLNQRQQHYEADFRFSLMRVRENAQSIALIGGEPAEGLRLNGLFQRVIANARVIIVQEKRVVLLKRAFGQMSGNVAYLLMAPRYFAGGLPLGALVQAQQAFIQIDVSLNWFIQNYHDLAIWQASVDRLTGFAQALEQAAKPTGFSHHSQPGEALSAHRLGLALPDGRRLAEGLALRFAKGSRTLITGPAGCGKSTLFNALAGIWPHGEGEIGQPSGARLLFLPQRPYLPIAPLGEAVCFPDSRQHHPDAAIAAALRRCGLPDLVPRLSEQSHWSQCLSPGEQQRLGFARALLIVPDFLFLDEASAALDEAAEAALYQLLHDALPATAIISIAHRPSLARFHSTRLEFGSIPAPSLSD